MNRVRVEYGSAGAQVVIRHWSHWFAPVILTAMAFGAGLVLLTPGGPELHIPAWFIVRRVLVAVLLTAAALLWLWSYVGERVVRVEAGSFVLRDQMFGVGLSREFEIASVRNLRERYKPASHSEIGAREYT